jgi:hypothetical protein
MSDFVKNIRFIAAGQDDPQSVALSECADRIEELEARVKLLEGYLRGGLEIVERFVACDTKDARAALEGE